MCLYIGSKSEFIAKHDITVYKQLEPAGRDKWRTPRQHWPVKLETTLIPEGKANVDKCGFKFQINGGAIHAYTKAPNDTREFFKATIPAGTKFWIQDDLSQVAAEKLYLTSIHPEPNEETDFSEYFYLGVDVHTKSGIRKNVSELQPSDEVIGIYAYENQVISTEIFGGLLLSDSSLDELPKGGTVTINGDKALEDIGGVSNCKALEKLGGKFPALEKCRSLGKDWYLPSEGELKRAFENLLYINFTLKKLGLAPIPFSWFWSSTLCNRQYAWGCGSRGGLNDWGYYRIWYGDCVLPFLEVLSGESLILD